MLLAKVISFNNVAVIEKQAVGKSFTPFIF